MLFNELLSKCVRILMCKNFFVCLSNFEILVVATFPNFKSFIFCSLPFYKFKVMNIMSDFMK